MLFAPPAGTALARFIGSGTMFDVALVRESEALLVCKRLTSRTRAEPAARAAIAREARVLAIVRHRALPAIVRVGSDEHGPFILETQADGVALDAIDEAWRDRGRAVPARLVGHIAQAAAEALAELAELADEHGPLHFVHADIAPDHVLLGPIGDVRFVDFGAARCRGLEPTDIDERGSLPYVAPEVARGEQRPNAGSDVYALAATIVFLATGEPPCDAVDRAAMLVEIGERGVRLERLERASGLSSKQREGLRHALAFEAPARASARELAQALAD